MTTIAWDGVWLAADSMCSLGSIRYTTRKLVRLTDGGLLGAAGKTNEITKLVKWLNGDLPTMPKISSLHAIHVTPESLVYLYAGGCDDMPVLDQYVAVGTGGDIALGAMESGKSAHLAVEIACRRDSGSGPPVESITLRPAAGLTSR